MDFVDKLQARIDETGSFLCIGIDPHPEDLASEDAAGARAFALDLIERTRPSAAAYKPNIAFFEALGPEGLSALAEVIEAAGEVPVVLDAKRGDIASTARAYAMALYDRLGADAVTLHGYLGRDSITPFLAPGRGVFVLCRTSNPGSADLQSLATIAPDGQRRPLYLEVARMCRQLDDGRGRVGLVVGATWPEALRRVRQENPEAWVLAPGIGAQGADLEAAVAAGLRRDGSGLLVPVSRAIARAPDPGEAAARLADRLTSARERARPWQPAAPTPPWPRELARSLVESGCVRFGEFTLKSGLISPFYIDLRRLIADPELLRTAAAAYLPLLEGLSFARLVALPYAALPIGTALSLLSGHPMIYPRKETKAYGTAAAIEGQWEAGERVVVVDDLATTGGSKVEAFDKLEAAGLEVAAVAVLIDRESGARSSLQKRGVPMHAVFTMTALLDFWRAHGLVDSHRLDAAARFVEDSAP